ncbi:MAG: cytochrome C, partial [Gammaproteobacteria bacterium]|nr:cytochrome C [Gammaproteobacteria bacterium]
MLRNVIVFCAVFGVSIAGFAAEVTYRKDIRPLWEKKCSACHGASAPYLGDFKEDQKKFEAM